MKLRNLTLIGLNLLAAGTLIVMSVGCSGSDDNSPTGPSNAPGANTIYDEITVSLTQLSVKYDCDYDPVGVTQPGDFRFNLNVDTLSDDGSSWLAVTKHGETAASLSTGGYKNVTDRKAAFRFPRLNGQAFRVRLSMREVDTDGNDFTAGAEITHIYSAASTQMYAPEGTNYASWNSATDVGTMNWNVNKRDRTWVLGVLTNEGCNATLHYSVTVREVA